MELIKMKRNLEFNNMSNVELQEWTTRILGEAQCENAMNQNLESTSIARMSHFERNAIDAAIACHGLFIDNDDEEKPPPVRRQRLWLPQSTLSNETAHSNNRNVVSDFNDAVILETIDSLGLLRRP
ncbi:uncharacterized protein DMAD_00974 [Drosophila madeirensis]|uniref:Uncharacterized protein n=2 Tax=Drosophila madeirensis TaxID=30013 RepID=A0AAU9G0F1_DROMD